MEWRQQFYRAAISSNGVQLSPMTTSSTGCTRDISRPPYLAVTQINLTTASATPPLDFYPAGGCAIYEITISKLT